MDSRWFTKACKANKLKPFNVATHIAFDGTSKIDLVLKNGLVDVYSTQFSEMVKPVFKKKDLKCATDPTCKSCPPQKKNSSKEENISEAESSSQE